MPMAHVGPMHAGSAGLGARFHTRSPSVMAGWCAPAVEVACLWAVKTPSSAGGVLPGRQIHLQCKTWSSPLTGELGFSGFWVTKLLGRRSALAR